MRYFLLFSILFAFFSCKDEDSSSDDYTSEQAIIPHIYINIDNNEEVIEKGTYLSADITIDGKNKYDSYSGRTEIRGRGNDSWNYPKKPYRIKLESKTSLFGLAPYKSWILLSEYLDGSMLYNSIPFETARILGIPFTNHVIPVELTINGEYRGFYAFMEHKEVGPNRIDVGEDGVLLELDTYFDEDWQFKSEKFDLPVMIAHPEDINQQKFNQIKNDFETFESLVADPSFPNNNYLDYFDDLSFVNYMIVYELTQNTEINHPKSTYINKLAGGKYRMGIIWDFDWAYGYSFNQQHYNLNTVDKPIFVNGSYVGKNFFSKFMEDPHIRNLFKERWNWFRSNHFEKLKNHVKDYADLVGQAIEADHQVWGARNSSGNIENDLQNTLNWLDARAAYLDNYVNSFN
ncbi:MAG: CotH kinase family protein [Weeksellaceae bacterium]|jgi:hypothetical protein|nr:CotH kinase family protein [Weeksellaceae bacterium]MDX9704167.1 CotH kinase family protein [Weeksellaceae bacterium]